MVSLSFKLGFVLIPSLPGIGIMIATALENNGATVYIIGRRLEVIERAAREHSVRPQRLCFCAFDSHKNLTFTEIQQNYSASR